METLLHIGFHKTGTTTLQGQFFPSLHRTAVVGPVNPGAERFLALAGALCQADDRDYTGNELRALFASAGNGFDRLVVSLETFSHLRQGDRTARRLNALLPDAKVLIVVRDQRTLLYSSYLGLLSKGGQTRFARFLTTVDPTWLEFDVVVAQYQRLFGVERVKVLPFELLESAPDRYLGEVRAFLAPEEAPPVDEIVLRRWNRGVAPPTRTAIVLLNRWIPNRRAILRFLTRLDPLIFPHMRRAPDRRDGEAADQYAQRYAASNSRLEQWTGLSLSSYGYVLSDPSPRSESRG